VAVRLIYEYLKSKPINSLKHHRPGTRTKSVFSIQVQLLRERTTTNKPNRVVWSAIVLLALIGVAIVVRRTIQVVPILLNGYHPPAVQSPSSALDDVFARHVILTLIHIVPGLFFVLLGPLQFSSTIRTRYIRWHRWSGYVFFICGLIIGISALVMSFAMPAIGGLTQATATALFALYFLLSLIKALLHIRSREIALHREWMVRAFSIGMAVATIRPIVGVFFATSRISGLTPFDFFGIAFWIGFILHAIAAEIWIQRTRQQIANLSVGVTVSRQGHPVLKERWLKAGEKHVKTR
jgi:hypothetical protein